MTRNDQKYLVNCSAENSTASADTNLRRIQYTVMSAAVLMQSEGSNSIHFEIGGCPSPLYEITLACRISNESEAAALLENKYAQGPRPPGERWLRSTSCESLRIGFFSQIKYSRKDARATKLIPGTRTEDTQDPVGYRGRYRRE